MSGRLRDIASPGRRDALNIDPKLIKIEESFNPRQYTLAENREHLDQLKASIRQVGVKVPLLVRWDSHTEQAILIDGECRLRACLELIAEGVPIKAIPVLQETAANEPDRLLLALATNTGKPLSILECGGAYKRLIAFGWASSDIAEKTGKSKTFVDTALEMADAPQEVKEMVSKGEITPSLAKQVVREKGDKAGAALRERVASAKAKGKKVAKREPKPGKAAAAKKAEKSQIDQEREVGDKMAKYVIDEIGGDNEPLLRLAKKWNKLRGV